jgi:uncharacterized protein YjiS (DUF1127 family)
MSPIPRTSLPGTQGRAAALPSPALHTALARGRTLLRSTLAACRAELIDWRVRRGYRRDLLRLKRTSPHLLKDIGLSAEDVEQEVVKPFWFP